MTRLGDKRKISDAEYVDSALHTYRIGEYVNFYEEQEKEKPCQREITRLRVWQRGAGMSAQRCILSVNGGDQQEIIARTRTCPM